MYFNREFLYIFVYSFSCRYLANLGLQQLGVPVPNHCDVASVVGEAGA